MVSLRAWVPVVVCIYALLPGRAATIYDNGNPWLPPFGPEITAARIAADFQVSSAFSVTGFDFWSLEFHSPFSNYAGSLAWFVYADSAGSAGPGALVASGTASGFDRRNTGAAYSFPFASGSVFENAVPVPEFSLRAGRYWVSLKNGPLSRTSFDGFFWAVSDSPSTRALGSYTWVSDDWTRSGLQLAFRIHGQAEPEPATWVLFGSALAGLAAWKLRYRPPSGGR